MNTKAQSITSNVVLLTICLIVITVAVFSLGTFIDAFTMTIANIEDFSLSTKWSTMLEFPLLWFKMFFYMPVILIVLLIVWTFKTIIWKHAYTRMDEEEY